MEKSFGKYLVRKELGKGAMGVVYLAYDTALDRSVAIKTIASTMKEEEMKARFIREAQSTGKLRHNNIVTIYDFGTEGENLYIVMEYLEGQDLEMLIVSKAPIDILKRLEIIRQICLGLEYAHENGILHRDVKPANIRVLSDGTVKIVDFGLAAIHTSTLTKSDAVLGTPHYIAPERIQGERGDGRSDQFSVGLIFYELLTLCRPFMGDSISSIIFKILNTEPRRLDPKLISEFPELEFIIKKSIAKNINHRYASMKDMGEDIEALKRKMISRGFSLDTAVKTLDEPMLSLEDSGDITAGQTNLIEIKKTKSPRNIAALLVGAALAVASIVILFLFVFNHKPSPPSPVPVQNGFLSFHVIPYAVIEEAVNIDTNIPVSIPAGSRVTPLKLSLEPGKYRVVYSHPSWGVKKRVKIVTIKAGESIFEKDFIDENFTRDAILHFSIKE